MQQWIKTGILLLACCGSGKALAGSWGSTGSGERLSEQQNPWFIGNTNKVSYCVHVDAGHAGLDQAAAAAVVRRALAFWHKEFAAATVTTLADFGTLGVGSQTWDEHPCTSLADPSVDVHFQFGVLSKEQEAFLQRPTDYAGISVQTEYDAVKLRAKGFVYIAPVQGPLAFRSGPRPGVQLGAAFAECVYAVVQHELGHVYGLPHAGIYGLMAERFADFLYAGPAAPVYDHFFTLRTGTTMCMPPQSMQLLAQIFAGPSHAVPPCMRFRYRHKPDDSFADTILEVYAGQDASDPGELLGSAVLSMTSFFPNLYTLLTYTKAQRLFTPAELAKGIDDRSLLAIAFMQLSKAGTYRSVDGRTETMISQTFIQGDPMLHGTAVVNRHIAEAPF